MLTKSTREIRKKTPTLKRGHRYEVLCAIDGEAAHSTAMYQHSNGELEVRSVQGFNTLRRLLSLMRANDHEGQSVDYSRLIGHYLTSNFFPISDKWLKDGDVYDYFLIKSNEANVSTCVVMDPSYFRDGYFQETLFARHLKNPTHPLFRRLQKAKFIACPIVHNHHYYLVFAEQVEPNKFKIGCLDGFNDSQTHQLLFEQAKKCLKFFKANDSIEIDTKSYLIPPQNNAVDCGVVAAYYFEKFCQTVATEKSSSLDDCFSCYGAYDAIPCDYSLFRSKIASTLLEEQVGNAKKKLPVITPAFQRQIKQPMARQVILISENDDLASIQRLNH